MALRICVYILKKKVNTLIIDATEREHFRPKDYYEQRALYSGKQGYHTIKNTVICDEQKYIHFLGLTTQGSMHDLELLRLDFDPKLAWFKTFKCLVDLGYLGFNKDFKVKNLEIPFKKPKKEALTTEQKDFNKNQSSVRVIVENAICGIKRWACLCQRYRNKKRNFEDKIIRIAAGIWNLHLLNN